VLDGDCGPYFTRTQAFLVAVLLPCSVVLMLADLFIRHLSHDFARFSTLAAPSRAAITRCRKYLAPDGPSTSSGHQVRHENTFRWSSIIPFKRWALSREPEFQWIGPLPFLKQRDVYIICISLFIRSRLTGISTAVIPRLRFGIRNVRT